MKRRYVYISILILTLFCIIWNVYDNNRVTVTEQTVELDKLPASFDGYTILQISDLHGKYFGENQSKLLSVINNTDYDCILFTGDMNKYEDSDMESSQAVFDLIDGIENMDTVFWTDGNTGPFAVERIDGNITGSLTDIGENIEEKGVSVLLSPVEITRDGESIWFVPDICLADIQMNYQDQEYGWQLEKWYEELNGNGQVKIRVDHYPVQADLAPEVLGYLDYDLSIAGHYHGGQIRLPVIGAVYIPSPSSGILNGYFPKQSEVKGLNKVGDMQQYISAGLGSSGSVPFLDFRLFNTPEINCITLRCKKSK